MSVLLNTTAMGATIPTFAAQATFATGPGTEPLSVAVGDFNGDKKLDLVVANQGLGNVGDVVVLLNTTATGLPPRLHSPLALLLPRKPVRIP